MVLPESRGVLLLIALEGGFVKAVVLNQEHRYLASQSFPPEKGSLEAARCQHGRNVLLAHPCIPLCCPRDWNFGDDHVAYHPVQASCRCADDKSRRRAHAVSMAMSTNQEPRTSFDAEFWERPYAQARTVLFCPTAAIGDAILLTAVVSELKRQYPHLQIVLCGQEPAEWVFRHHPAITAFLPAGGTQEAHARAAVDVVLEYEGLIARLPEYYNGIGLLEILANIAGIRLGEPQFAYDVEPSEAEAAAALLRPYGECLSIGVQLWTPKDERRSYPHRRALLQELHRRLPEALFIWFGTEPFAAEELPWLLDCGRLRVPFRLQVALAFQCAAFLTIDSVFFHIGRLLCRKPTLLLAGVTNPLLFGGYGIPFAFFRNERLPCLNCYWRMPCRRECMEELSPGAVAEAFERMLRQGVPPLPPLPVVELELRAGEAWKGKLLHALWYQRTGVRLRLRDRDGILPPYAQQWNGVEVETGTAAPTAPEDGVPFHIVWEGTQFQHHSLAIVNRAHCLNVLRGTSAELTLVPYETDAFSPEGHADYELLAAHDVRRKGWTSPATIWIRHQWPPNPAPPPSGARWIVMQPYEFGAWPQKYLPAFQHAEEIWTPSTASRLSFVRSGIPPEKVQVIPNGIDPQRFRPDGERFPLSTAKRFRLLFVGGTLYRKGVDILLRAYLRAFSAADDVCLVIKELGSTTFYQGVTMGQLIERLCREPEAPEICYVEQVLTEEEMAALYRACTVFVSPYRGEGFSLPTLEAMACGLPVIVTAGGATDDFVDESVGWRLPAQRRSLGWTLNGLPMANEAFLLEPDSEALVQLLRQLYEEPAVCRIKGIRAAGRARQQWTWKRATVRLLTRIDVLCGTSLSREAEERLPDAHDGSILLARAEEALAAGQLAHAYQWYEQAVSQAEGMPLEYRRRAYLQLALLKLSAGDGEEAQRWWHHAFELSSNSPDVLYGAALLEAWRGRWERSREILQHLLDHWHEERFRCVLELSRQRLLREYARACLFGGWVEEADPLYQELLQQGDEEPELLLEAAYAAELRGQHARAEALRRRADDLTAAAETGVPVPPAALPLPVSEPLR